MSKSNEGELSSEGDGRAELSDERGGGGGGLSIGMMTKTGSHGGLSPMAQATIEKHLSGPSKRILLSQAMNKKSASREMGTITGKYQAGWSTYRWRTLRESRELCGGILGGIYRHRMGER